MGKKGDENNNIGILRLIRRSYKHLSISQKIKAVFLFFALIFSRFLEVSSSEKLGEISKNIKEGDNKKLKWTCIFYVLYIVFSCLASNLSIYFLTPIFKSVTTLSAIDQIKNIYGLDYKEFYKNGFGHYATCVNRSSLALSDITENIFCKILPTVFLVIFSAIQFFRFFNITTTAAFIFTSIVFIFVSYHAISRRMTYKVKYNKKENQISNSLTEKFRNRDTVVTHNLVDREVNNVKSQYVKQQEYITNVVQAVYLTNIFQEGIFRVFFFSVIFGSIIFSSMESKVKIETMVIAVSTLSNVWKHLSTISQTIHLWMKAKIDIKSGFMTKRDLTAENNKIVIKSIKKIEFKNIVLNIGENKIFNGLNVTIQSPIRVAIAGKNGTGKSTLIKTFLEFYKYKGEVFINNINVNEINKKSFFNAISYSSQDPHLFDGNIIENIKYGNKSEFDNISKMAKYMEIHESIMQKRKGYMKNVGYMGNKLSGGEKQKILMLRSVLREADVYLFDEPTANVDKKSEYKMIQTMLEVLKGKIVIAVVHNVDLLSLFDKIIFIHDNKVRDFANHFDLLEKDEIYKSYFKRTHKTPNYERKSKEKLETVK